MGLKGGLLVLGGMPIPRADFLADITTKHPISQLLRDWLRYGATQFDGVVADALGSSHDFRLNDGSRRASVQAARAGAAVIRGRRIRLQLYVDD